MRILRLKDLPDNESGHFLAGVVPGEFLYRGAITYKKPNERTHTKPGDADYHVHEDSEVFIILQGKARMELNGAMYPLKTGDIFVVEPGEDHHLISDAEEPCVSLWCHAGPNRHKDQLEN
ncbi:cupin domain-containing protein [Candidatus Sumerlaeota bacterium]|nr:cupin domain-containing protein [Candidatus Sumerlaeota bacterium]